MKYLLFILLFTGAPVLGFTQTQVLTLDDAIDMALANNPDISIQKQYTSIAENKVSKANAGLLPKVDAVGSISYTNNYADLELRTFQPEPPKINVSEAGVATSTANLGVEASYVLFDGGAGKYRLQLFEGLSALERAKQEVIANNIILGITELYFEIVKLQNQIQLLQKSVQLSRDRIQKMENRAEFGKANKLAILQTTTNLNQDLSSIDNINIIRQSLLIDLKVLINDLSDQDYELASEYNNITLPDQQTINEKIRQHNPEVQITNMGISISEMELKLANTERKPVFAAFGNAGYFWQKNDVQQLAQIQTIGATLGISARYNLYDGGVNKIKVQNAQIGQQIQTLTKKRTQEQLTLRARKETQTMQLLQARIQKETEDQVTYQENYNRVLEQFQLGKVPEITIREAQLALINSNITKTNLQMDYMKSNTRLQVILGDYIQ